MPKITADRTFLPTTASYTKSPRTSAVNSRIKSSGFLTDGGALDSQTTDSQYVNNMLGVDSGGDAPVSQVSDSMGSQPVIVPKEEDDLQVADDPCGEVDMSDTGSDTGSEVMFSTRDPIVRAYLSKYAVDICGRLPSPAPPTADVRSRETVMAVTKFEQELLRAFRTIYNEKFHRMELQMKEVEAQRQHFIEEGRVFVDYTFEVIYPLLRSHGIAPPPIPGVAKSDDIDS